MLGSDLVKFLSPFFLVTPISKGNYISHIHKTFDVVINANGNSKRFWANQNPQDDFIASTVSVYKSIFDFHSDLYVYISSPDVYENHTRPEYTKENEEIDPKNLQPYGFHKYLSELIVKKYKEKFLILRSAMLLGTNLKKGPIYDTIHDQPIFITSKSRLQLITTHAMVEIIRTLLENFVKNETLNIGGIGTFTFEKIKQYLNKKNRISFGEEMQIYEMNVEKIKSFFPSLKTSENYLQEFLDNDFHH